jgi:flagellar L-ring protein precursor FlgH
MPRTIPHTFFWLALGLGLGAAVATAGAESLTHANASWCSPVRLYRAGDIITVVIAEDARAEQSASTALYKDSEVGYSAGGAVATLLPSASIGMNADHKGGGELARRGRMTARVAAVVEEVLPNGNLRVRGMQEMNFDSGRQLIGVEGVARPRDITAENEILSYRLANAKIDFTGRDALHEKARTGILARVLEWLWIF